MLLLCLLILIHPVIRILIVEDNPDFSQSLVELVNAQPGMEVAACYLNGKNLVRHLEYHKPDVVLMDIDMPVVNGLESLRQIQLSGMEVVSLVLTVFDDNERVFQAVCSGASGYLLKHTSNERIIEAIVEAKNGGAPMTPSVARQVLQLFSKPYRQSADFEALTSREQDVLSLLVRGFSYKMAAAELKISLETLRSHVKNIYSKLHVNSNVEAVAKAIQHGIK